MTVFHIFYIPTVFLLGIVIGATLGKRNAIREIAHQEKARREREERKTQRATERNE
jgi:hypothetical protein